MPSGALVLDACHQRLGEERQDLIQTQLPDGQHV